MLICDQCYIEHHQYIRTILDFDDITWDKYWSDEICELCGITAKNGEYMYFEIHEKIIIKLIGRLKTLDDKVAELEKKLDETKLFSKKLDQKD